jgi:hypothetical protein
MWTRSLTVDQASRPMMERHRLNHCLRWNVNSARGYERLIGLVIARVAR